jgi:hypothetical protein
MNNYWTKLRIFIKKSGVLYHQWLNFELPYHLIDWLIWVQHLVRVTTWRIKETTHKPNSTRHGYDLDTYVTLIYSELKEKDTRIYSLQTALILRQVYSGSCAVQLIQWFDFPLSNRWLFQYGLPRNLPSLCLPSSYPVIRHTYNTSKTSSYKFSSISHRHKYQLYISTLLTDAMSLRPTTLQSSLSYLSLLPSKCVVLKTAAFWMWQRAVQYVGTDRILEDRNVHSHSHDNLKSL